MLTIADIAQIYDGPHATPLKTESGPYFLSISSLEKGRLDLSKSAHLSFEDLRKWTKRVTPEPGDLLFSYETRLGEAALMPKGIDACLGRRMGLLRPNRSLVLPEYLLYFYLSPAFQQTIVSNTIRGATVDRIPITEMSNFPISIPSLENQAKIVELLKSLDDKILLNNRINAELEQMAKTLYDYWFVQFDFPNEDGEPYKSSGGKMFYDEVLKKEIPQGWEVGTLEDIGNLLGGGTPRKEVPEYWNGAIPFFTPKDYEKSVFATYTESHITEVGLASCSSRLYPKGTIFITARGTVGNINIASTDMAMNQSCYAVTTKPGINYYFLHQFCVNLIQYMKVKAAGSVFDALVSNDFKLTSAVIPARDTIDLFGQRTASFYERILNNKLQNQQLASLRDWLLPMLMNGQVTVGEVLDRSEEDSEARVDTIGQEGTQMHLFA
ncbi:restriction endonuclease subunit S [Dyadobacter sp. OTU695]|uniref:restriction endonuclease subunit S n=1 Tax=Dyadobacter sp. OTU695 TaxID=3043860 RepID=UPI00313BEE6C